MTRSGLKKLFFCIAGAGLAIGGGILVCLLPGRGTKPGISIVGRTNDPAKGPSVVFSLTNRTASQMFYVVCPPQLKSGGIWPPLPQVLSNTLDLLSHQSTNFSVAIPFDANAWRVPLFYGYSPSGVERFKGKVHYNLTVNWYLLKRGQRPRIMNNSDLNIYVSYSPEMGNQSSIEHEGATNRNRATNN